MRPVLTKRSWIGREHASWQSRTMTGYGSAFPEEGPRPFAGSRNGSGYGGPVIGYEQWYSGAGTALQFAEQT